MEFLQFLISTFGVALALLYVIGGLVVNLYLSRYGLTEYQIVRVKYLAVGLTFFLNYVAILLLAGVIGFLVAPLDFYLLQGAMLFSVLVSVVLLWLWTRHGVWMRGRTALVAWVILSASTSVFPVAVVIRVPLAGSASPEMAILVIEAILTGFLSFVAQLYYYSRRIYGQSLGMLGEVDPVGMGIPVDVQLAGDKEGIGLLAYLGVPVHKENLTDRVSLMDETDTHYIIGVKHKNRIRAIKVTKDIVKAILYLDDHAVDKQEE
ncbi:MAG: hypothetical protein WCF84_14745 [Anaerolineae bacterium]